MSTPIIVIAGPTASGKSACAVRLCERIGGEVVSADSMQIYRGMDVGTAKPDAAERRGIVHHLIDVAEPSEKWSAAEYRDRAAPVIDDVHERGLRAVLCGGTGLYINAVTRPMSFCAEGESDVRAELLGIAEADGGRERLHAMLRAVDPESANRLHANDVRRVARALEVHMLTGRTMTEISRADAAREGPYAVRMFGLRWPRERLIARIDERVEQMVARGLIDEVRALMDRSPGCTAMQALGYKEIAAALRGDMGMDEAIAQIKLGTRQYAKRQMSWFRHDERVHWLDADGRTADELVDQIIKEIS